MAIINQSNILNLQPGITAPVVVHMSEGDSGTKLSFKLIDGARAWTDPGNVVAAVHGRRQDGTQFGPYSCTISGDVVSFQTDAAIAAVAGSGIAQIVLTDSDQNTAGTANFAIMVERATFPMGVTYTNDKSVYEAILAYAQTIPAQVTENLTAKIDAETAAREAADATLNTKNSNLQSELEQEVQNRTTHDAVLSARMDEFSKLPSGSMSTAADAELVDIRVKADGTKASTAGNAVREQFTELNNQMEIIQTYNWKNGYVATNGTIVSNNTYTTRKYSELIVCPANTPVTYVAEKSANVYGISFWDANKTFISGIAYTGDDAENTVTSPANTMYARLSTTSELLSESYIAFSGTGMIALGDAINTIDRRFLRYIPFTTNGTIRSEQYTDLQEMISAEVIDDAYEIVLYYNDNDGQHNTGWQKRINVQSYNNPTYLRLRKADNSVMPAGSATTVAAAIRSNGINGIVMVGDIQDIREQTTELKNAINTIDRRFLRYIPFTTNGTIRSEQYTDLQEMISAEVIDDAYEIALWYNDGQRNTEWQKRINVQSYNNPTYLLLRKADNSVMPAGSATTVATAIRSNGIVMVEDIQDIREQLEQLDNGLSGYVDGTNGNDSNPGDSWETAFATIQKAIDAGYKSIRIKPGTYAAGISMSAMQGVHIYCDKSFDSFDATTAPNNSKVIIDCNNSLINGVLMQSCIDCSITDIEVKNATGNGFDIRGCSGDMLFNGCISHDNPGGQGFCLLNTNAAFISCGVYNIGTMGGGQHHDGFNIHGTGTTSFKDCWGHDCEDDGISHHDACYGYIDGGEWYNCGKGGVASPTHGAKIDVTNVYSHDNNYGLYAENGTASLAKISNISNCVFKDNAVFDISSKNNTLNIWNCVYDTINHSSTGSNNIIN